MEDATNTSTNTNINVDINTAVTTNAEPWMTGETSGAGQATHTNVSADSSEEALSAAAYPPPIDSVNAAHEVVAVSAGLSSGDIAPVRRTDDDSLSVTPTEADQTAQRSNPNPTQRSHADNASISSPNPAHDPDQAPGTLGNFLWQLLSVSLADDDAYSNKSTSPSPQMHPSKPPVEVLHGAKDPDPIHIEMVATKHSMIDLSSPMNPPAISPAISIPATASSSSASSASSAAYSNSQPNSTSPGIAASLFSFGRSFFTAPQAHKDTSSSLPTSSSSAWFASPTPLPSNSLSSATRQERDSLLDLATAPRPVKLLKPDLPDKAQTILSAAVAALIRPHLSPLHREASAWRLIYSLDHHGISLNTLYHKCESQAGLSNPVLLVIKDSDGCTFGAFASEAFRVQHGYFGNGSCFLFKLKVPPPSSHSDSSQTDTPEPQVSVFKATGANDYLVLGEAHFIALGGGEGHFGLWIDQDLYNGHSGPCQTFNNEQLSRKSEFIVQSLELWAFDI
ncbi:oxidation resistance protein 1 [Chytriomyces hyalinus]|nr:oxidation resistance protein 1 [Chytriomyces hyalinus]